MSSQVKSENDQTLIWSNPQSRTMRSTSDVIKMLFFIHTTCTVLSLYSHV